MVDSDSICDVGDMFYDPGERSIGIVPTVGPSIARFEVDTDQPTGPADGIDLGIGQIARGGTDGMNIGMAHHEGSLRDLRDIPESRFIEMCKIDEDSQSIALSDQLLACR